MLALSCFVFWGIASNFFLIPRHDAWVKGTALNTLSVVWLWGPGEGVRFYPLIRSQSSGEPMLWAVSFTRVSQCIFFPHSLGGTRRLEWGGAGYFPFAGSEVWSSLSRSGFGWLVSSVCAAVASGVYNSAALWRQAPLSWDSPDKDTGRGCHTLLQGIFQTQGSNPSLLLLLNCRQILYRWATSGEADVKKQSSGKFQNGLFSPPPTGNTREFFSALYCGKLVELPGVNLTILWGPACDWVPWRF